MKLAMGTLREFSEASKAWHAEALSLRKRTSYLLRVHVYQVKFGFNVCVLFCLFVRFSQYGLGWFALVCFGLVWTSTSCLSRARNLTI